MMRWLPYFLMGLILSPVAFANGGEDKKPGTASVVSFGELMRRQKSAGDADQVLRKNVDLRAQYVANRHAQAFARLGERMSTEEIERAFDLIESIRLDPQFGFWIGYCYFPEALDPKHQDYMFGEFARAFGPDFVAGHPGHYVPNPEMIELTVALHSGRLGVYDLVDALPSGMTKEDAIELGCTRRRAHARELHEKALASVLEHRSAVEIEDAFASLYGKYGEYALKSWIRYCYLRNTPGPQSERSLYLPQIAEDLGPEFLIERDGQVEPNPAMIEYTLALTNGDLDQLGLVDELPSGKHAFDVMRDAKARQPADLVLHVRARVGNVSRRDASAEPLDRYLTEMNPKFRTVTFDFDPEAPTTESRTAALAHELRTWLNEHAGRVGLVVIEGDGLGALTDLTSWSGRPALSDGLLPLRGRLAEDGQIVVATDRGASQLEQFGTASRMLLDDLGAPKGAVVGLTSPREHIPTFFTAYLNGARVAMAGTIATVASALFSGVTEPSHLLFVSQIVPALYLAARPFYAVDDGRRLVPDHRRDGLAALGAGLATLAGQTAVYQDPSATFAALGLGQIAFFVGTAAQYAMVSVPRLWRADQSRLNAGVRFAVDKYGVEKTDMLRFDQDQARVFTCESDLKARASESRASFSVVR